MSDEIIYTHKDKIDIADNKIYIEFTVIDNSRIPVKRFPLVLDTGAFITLISKERAVRNGYKIVTSKGCIIAGFSEKGLVCDLRILSAAVFCGYCINDVLVATPHYNDVVVTEVLGMNIIENFDLGFSFNKREIYAGMRGDFISQKPRYKCGIVSLFQESNRKEA